MFYVTGLFAEFLGFSLHCVGDSCTVAASSTIPNIIIAVLMVLFFAFYPQINIQTVAVNDFGLLHKIIAFLIDFFIIVMVVSPFSALPLLLAEFNHTGVFAWAFERDYSRSSDSLYSALILLFSLMIIGYYFYKHKKLKRPTLGQYLLSGIK